MSSSSRFVVGFVTLFLVVFALAGPFIGYSGAWLMFGLSPFLVIWMVIRVLKDTSHPVAELEEGDEWGYADRPDLRPVW